MKLKMRMCALLGATVLVGAGLGQPAVAADKPGSLHLQCDGFPNNVSAGETAARLVGAITLLGIFAPPMENADSSKRKFGAEGVAVCSSLVEAGGETNVQRRIGLILARAVHHIEAKNYQAALDDVALARRDAESGGFLADPYFGLSRARAFDLIGASALFRLGRQQEAQEAVLRSYGGAASWPLFSSSTYSFALPKASDAELDALRRMALVMPSYGGGYAGRLEELGRFAEAARMRDAVLAYWDFITPKERSSHLIARAALAHALAGDAEKAAGLFADARANAEKRKVDGKPEPESAELVELMDFLSIVTTAEKGDLATARRLFAGRSEWPSVSFGAVVEMNRRLRAGASAGELIGALALDGEALWKQRAASSSAAIIAKDADNKTLFGMIPGLTPASQFQAASSNVWRVEKSRILLKPDAKRAEELKGELLFMLYHAPAVTLEAYRLHAALLARSRGHKGFSFRAYLSSQNYLVANIVTGNAGDPGIPAPLFNDADEVIAALSPLIPSPATLKTARK